MSALIKVILWSFFLFPIFWIVLISVQPENTAFFGKYKIIPEIITLDAYNDAIYNKRGGVIKSILYSFRVSGISTLLSFVFAISAIYMVRVDIISDALRSGLYKFSVGLYFLPVFLIYPGIDFLSGFIGVFDNTLIKLIYVNVILGYVICFFLLMLIYVDSEKKYFEQLLLETGSRIYAFYYGVIVPNYNKIIYAACLTFATIWGEFYLSNFITTFDIDKPFSVILQMSQEQYSTEYSVFAVGAVLSFIAFMVFYGFISMFAYAFKYLITKEYS